MDGALLTEAVYAIGIGLIVGIEREHSEVAGALDDGAPPPAPAEIPRRRHHAIGARTAALLGLVGWLLAFLGEREPWIFPVGLVAVVALIAAQLHLSHALGMTTEVAGVVVLLLGALVHLDRPLAVALCVGTTVVLVAKPWTHRFIVQLRRIEILATLQLLLLVAIVLPLVPPDPVDPWGALPPHEVGVFVLLIASVQYVGYVLTRLLGPIRAAGIAGLLGGLTSSTAVTVSMARAVRETPALLRAAQLGTFLAAMVMPVRVTIIAGAVSPDVGARIAPAMGAMAAVLLVAALVTWRRLRAEPAPGPTAVELRNPFELWGALSWGLVLCGVLLVARLATLEFGDQGLLVAAAVSGLPHLDAITLAAAGQVGDAAAPLGADVAALAIAIAACSNTLAKGAIAWLGGGRAFGRSVALVFGVAVAATAATALYGMLAS